MTRLAMTSVAPRHRRRPQEVGGDSAERQTGRPRLAGSGTTYVGARKVRLEKLATAPRARAAATSRPVSAAQPATAPAEADVPRRVVDRPVLGVAVDRLKLLEHAPVSAAAAPPPSHHLYTTRTALHAKYEYKVITNTK